MTDGDDTGLNMAGSMLLPEVNLIRPVNNHLTIEHKGFDPDHPQMTDLGKSN